MFIMNNALIKSTNISFVFHKYHNYFMAFIVIFAISVMTSVTIFPLIWVDLNMKCCRKY